MDTLKRTVEVAISPLGIMSLFLVGGVILSLSGRRLRQGRRLLLSGVLLYLIFTFSPLAEILVRSLEKPFEPMLVPPAEPKIERIVVLSGYGEFHPAFPVTSSLSGETVGRMTEGIRLHRLLPGSRLIVSGGVVREGDGPIALLMADFARQLGVRGEDILIERSSSTTYENLLEVRKMVGSNPFVLVTSACDLRRASAVARKLGMVAIPAPACIWALQHYPASMNAGQWITSFLEGFVHPSPTRLTRIQWAYHEYAGYLWYRLLGRV
jgi:uncharacterized SAM-binding protein YcdF (DUF218 family)